MGDCASCAGRDSCAGRRVEFQPARALPRRSDRALKQQRSAVRSGSFRVQYPMEHEISLPVLLERSCDDTSQSDLLSLQGRLKHREPSLATAAHRLSLALTSEHGMDSEHTKHLEALAGTQPECRPPQMPWSEKVCEADRDTQSLKAQLASSKELDQHYNNITPRLGELKTEIAQELPAEVRTKAREYRARVMRDMDPDTRMHWTKRHRTDDFSGPLVCADVAQNLDRQKAVSGEGATVVAVSAVLRE